ncbi:hypothetical protein [Helicobacter rodentium]|nr:hypothetical protein [Helicobacter rodentium]
MQEANAVKNEATFNLVKSGFHNGIAKTTSRVRFHIIDCFTWLQ